MSKPWLHWRAGLVLLALVVAVALPQVASGYTLGVLTTAFYFAVYAMAWDLLFGYAGEVNFGPTFLIGIGAYAAGLCNSALGWPIWACVPIGTLAAMVGGLILVAPALRLRGPYFGLVTLVAVLLLGQVIVLFSGTTGGEIGLALRDILTISSEGNFYYALGLMTITALVLRVIVRSPLGLILEASGQDPVATEALGFSVAKYKIVAFTLSAFFSGLAGAMTVFYYGTASPGTVVAVAVTVQIIIATIIGGRRSIIGAILGAVFLIAAGELLRPLGQISATVVSFIALVVLVFAPGGIISLFGGGGERRL